MIGRSKRRLWKYGARITAALVVYLLMAYGYFLYRNESPGTRVTMDTSLEGVPDTPVSATRAFEVTGKGEFSPRNTTKTIPKKKTIPKTTTVHNKSETRKSSNTTNARFFTNASVTPTTSTHIPTSTTKQDRKSEEMSILTPVFGGRLGNQLFEYAAAYAIAKIKNMTLFIPEGNAINKLFHVDKTVVTFQGCAVWRDVFVDCCTYHAELATKINKNECQKIGLYLQSWKYFKTVEASIRRQLKFKQNIADTAFRKLVSLKQEFLSRHRKAVWLPNQSGHTTPVIHASTQPNTPNKSTLAPQAANVSLRDVSGRSTDHPPTSHKQEHVTRAGSGRRTDHPPTSHKQERVTRAGSGTSTDHPPTSHKQEHVTRAGSGTSTDHPPTSHKQEHVTRAGSGGAGLVTDVTYIGVHVRRGDYIASGSKRQGRTTPPAEYYIHAMNYFRAIYPNALFVVGGDDGNWVNRNIAAVDVVVLQRELPEVDLCVFSMCNHTIISVGSFGWWAGFLAGGTTVYYKHPFRNNTVMSNWYKDYHTDYVWPGWVPME